MYNYSFVYRKEEKRSIINYVYRNAFQDLPLVVLSHVCFGILFFNLFLHGTCICGQQNTSIVLAKRYILFCGSRESRELVLGTWV